MQRNEIINDCNSNEKNDLISRKAVIEEIELYEKELKEDREIAIESEDEQMLFAIANQNTALYRIKKEVFHIPAASIKEEKREEIISYVVICSIDREIKHVGTANTPSEATELMRTDFMKEFLKIYKMDDFENKVDCGDEWELGETQAFLNGLHGSIYDWRIITVDVPSEPNKKESVRLKDLLPYISYGTALDLVEQDKERDFVFNNHLFPKSDLITREVIERHYPELLEREVSNGIHAEGMSPDTIVVPIKKK